MEKELEVYIEIYRIVEKEELNNMIDELDESKKEKIIDNFINNNSIVIPIYKENILRKINSTKKGETAIAKSEVNNLRECIKKSKRSDQITELNGDIRYEEEKLERRINIFNNITNVVQKYKGDIAPTPRDYKSLVEKDETYGKCK